MASENILDQAARGYAKYLATIAVFSIAMSLLLFVSPLYMMQIYDRVLQSRSESTLLFLSIIAFALLGVYGVLDYARARLLARLGTQFDHRIARPLFDQVLRIQVGQPGSNVHQVLSDSGRLRDFLSGPGVSALCDLPWTPIFLVVCFAFHPLLGIISTLGAVVIFVLALLSEHTTGKTISKAHVDAVDAQGTAQIVMQNADAVRALGMEGRLTDRWFTTYQRYLDLHTEAGDQGGAIAAFSRFSRQALQTAMLGAAAYLALQNAISPGTMMAISIISGKALAPVDQIVGQWKQFVTARQAYGRMRRIFSALPTDAARTALPRPSGAIEVASLMLAAPRTREPIVVGVDFAVAAGETVAIVGPSGSGKSCLARALIGTFSPLTGTVRLDGSSVEQWDREAIGRHLGYVPQHVELFSGTIRQNISRFGIGTEQDVFHAARLAGIDLTIRALAKGYDTDIGPAARPLPGRLHQGIGLARAFFGNPAIVVLDEPTSNLDFDGRNALLAGIRALKQRGTTIVLISYDHGVQLLSDKVLILSDGRMQAFRPTSEMIVKSAGPSAPRSTAGTPYSTQAAPVLSAVEAGRAS